MTRRRARLSGRAVGGPAATGLARHADRRARVSTAAWLGLVALAVLLLVGLLYGLRGLIGGARPGRPRNVLLITLDTVRADRLGIYGHASARTPHLDQLAQAGVRFADATAPAPLTGPSHAALLTGKYPARLGVRDNATTPLPPEAVTLAEVLSARGFATGGFVGTFILDRPYGFAQGFQTFDSGFARVDSGTEANAERRGDAVVDAAVRWLSSLSEDSPFFAWVHLFDAHAPYSPPEPFATQFAGQPYDGEIAFVDHQVGRLLEALRTRAVLDRTLVVALADHGEALGDHGEDEHGVFLYEPVLRIPWIVAGPGVARGHVASEQARAIDLFPTLLEALGVEAPGGLDGSSLGVVLRGDSLATTAPSYAETYYPRLHFGWSELRSLRADGWKAIDAPRPELYNLRDDPGERRNLYDTHRARADRMIAQVSRLSEELGGAGPVVVRQPDPDTLERLRSLGYVGVAAPLPEGTRGPDPKDRIEARREYRVLVSEAIDDLRGGRPDAAAIKLHRLVQLNERAYDLHQLLGEAYERQDRLDEAVTEYEYAALLNPDVAAPLVAAAEVHLARNDVGAARTRLDEATRLEPRSFDVALVTGRVLEREGRTAEALTAYQQATTLNGANPRPRVLLVSLATRLGHYDLAEAQLTDLIRMGYQPSRSYFALGRIAQMRGNQDKAASHYREALRLEPGLAMAEEGLRLLERR